MTEEPSGRKDLVTYRREGHVAFITLNRPEKRNAMNAKLWKSPGEAVGMAEEDGEAGHCSQGRRKGLLRRLGSGTGE